VGYGSRETNGKNAKEVMQGYHHCETKEEGADYVKCETNTGSMKEEKGE